MKDTDSSPDPAAMVQAALQDTVNAVPEQARSCIFVDVPIFTTTMGVSGCRLPSDMLGGGLVGCGCLSEAAGAVFGLSNHDAIREN